MFAAGRHPADPSRKRVCSFVNPWLHDPGEKNAARDRGDVHSTASAEWDCTDGEAKLVHINHVSGLNVENRLLPSIQHRIQIEREFLRTLRTITNHIDSV